MRVIPTFGIFIVAFFTLPLFVDAMSPEKPEPAAHLAAVWNLRAQPCNGGGGNAMDRHPQEAAFKSSKVIDLDSLGLRFTVPQLFDVQRTVVKLFMGDRTRGVTDNYILISDNDLEPPFAAVVVTELPEQMQNHEQAFQAVNVLQGQLAAGIGITPSLDMIDGPFGSALEMIVRNRVGTHCFPTSDFLLVPDDQQISTNCISRFFLLNGYLIEFALVAVVPQDTPDDEAVVFARQAMDSFWTALEFSQ